MIEINDKEGALGQLILDEVTFENINSCGSVIGNVKSIIKDQNKVPSTTIEAVY